MQVLFHQEREQFEQKILKFQQLGPAFEIPRSTAAALKPAPKLADIKKEAMSLFNMEQDESTYEVEGEKCPSDEISPELGEDVARTDLLKEIDLLFQCVPVSP
jgi:hypothetical protein